MASHPVALPSCNTNVFSSTSFSSKSSLHHSLLTPPHHSSSTPRFSFSFSVSLSKHSSHPSSSCVARVSTAPVEYAPPAPEFDFAHELARLRALRSRLASARSLREKHRAIDGDARVNLFFRSSGFLARTSRSLSLDSDDLFLLKCLVAAGQEHVLGAWEGEVVESVRSSVKTALYALVEMIEKLDVNGGEGVGMRKVGGRLEEEEVEDLKKLLKTLREMEEFYDCIGGIIGSALIPIYSY